MTRLRVAAATHVGRVRSSNEDSYLVDDELGIFAVADGMGGHAAGEVASSIALDAIRSSLQSGSTIDTAVNLANSSVREQAANDPSLQGMGTTLTLLSILGTPTIGHVGDSRAYRLRDGDLQLLTDDHSLVAELVRAGRLTPEQAATHPRRSIITRALGADESVTVDLVPIEIREGDRLLLCSDGLPTMVSDEAIQTVLNDPADVPEVAQALIHLANAAGGDDNITVIVADVLEVDLDTQLPFELMPVESADDVQEDVAELPAVVDRDALPPAEEVASETVDEWVPPPETLPPTRRGRRFLAKVLGFGLPLVIIGAFTVGAVNWWAARSWFVEDRHGIVTLNQGVRGGFLWHDPIAVPSEELRVADLLPQDAIRLRDPQEFTNKTDALAFIAELRTGSSTPRITSSSSTAESTSTSTPTASSSSEVLSGP
ncbi:MAG: Stp1/IreP family PP2C-type Ser/Thr phosphatase [Acidimicrobiia bacterium]